MNRSLLSAALCALVLGALALSVEGRVPRKHVTPECAKKESSLLFPGLCLTKEDVANLGSVGRRFMAQHTVVDLEPVLLLPGLGGSGLDVKLDKTPDEPFFFCYKSHEWYRLWLALGSMLPGEIDCWYHNLGVVYNANNDTYSNNPGVSIRPIDFGGVKGIDYLDTFLGGGIEATAYYAPLIKDLEAVGYVVGKNLRGAPYDWRVARNPDNLYPRLKALIEEMYTQNGNKPVHMIGHSMGTIHTGEFLNEMTQAWKNQYISSFISIAGPWSGSPQALRAVISGDTFGLKLGDWLNIVNPLKVREIVRQAGGPIWMLPDVEFWNTTVLVKTPQREYTVADFPQLFQDLGTPITNTIYQKISGVQSEIAAPGVELHCLYGNNMPTEMSYIYHNGFDRDPEIIYSNDGDGVVPEVSLKKCQDFAHHQTQPVEVKEFDLASHMTVLNDEELLQYVLKVVTITH